MVLGGESEELLVHYERLLMQHTFNRFRSPV